MLGIGSGLPFGLNARHQLSWWTFGGGNEIVNAALKKLNVYGIPAGSTGAQMGAWFKKEINAIEDLKGLRIRVGALGAPIFERVGAKAHYLSHADVYSALESGTIDAAEFICPHDDERLGIAKLAKYNYHPCWWESGGMVHLVVNLERWNALPKSYRAIVERACYSANSWMLARYDALNPPALKRLVAAGAVLKSFPQPVLEACLQGRHRPFRRDRRQGRGLQEGARFRQRVPQGAASLVADRRVRLRQHIARHPQLTRSRHFSPVKFFSSGVQHSA